MRSHRAQPHIDRADIVELALASGMGCELMRTCYRAQFFPPHTHEYFTLGVVSSGVGTLGHRGTEHRLYPGDVVLIPPGDVHTGGTESADDALSYTALHLPADALTDCAVALGHPRAMPGIGSVVVRDADIAHALRRVDALVQVAPRDPAAVDDAVHVVMCSLCLGTPKRHDLRQYLCGNQAW